MAYYITIEDKKGHYLPLDISKSDCFTRFSNLKGEKARIDEIDKFTIQFDNEYEMRALFVKKDILPIQLVDKNLSIRRLHNGKYVKVMHDFLFQKDFEYFYIPEKLIEMIKNRLLNEDYRFVLQYVNHYINYRDCSMTAFELRGYITSTIRNGSLDKHLVQLDENGDTILERMTKLLIYQFDVISNGLVRYKTDNKNIKYRNLHSIIAFVNNYDKKYHNDNQLSLFDDVKTKKKTLKKNDIPGQISFF